MKEPGLLQVGLSGGREMGICLGSLWISSSVDPEVSELVPCWLFLFSLRSVKQLQFDFCLLFGASFCAGLGLFSCHLEAVELFLCIIEASANKLWWI